MYGMMQSTGMFFGGAMMWIVWIFVALLVFVAIKAALGGSSSRDGGESNALALLKERFARGEIDEREYRARRSELRR